VLLALGKREAEERTVSIRRLGSQQTRTLPLTEAVAAFVAEATAPDIRRAEAVAETVPSSDTVLDGHHVVQDAP
jgi:threonyl-tRNA synthetase